MSSATKRKRAELKAANATAERQADISEEKEMSVKNNVKNNVKNKQEVVHKNGHNASSAGRGVCGRCFHIVKYIVIIILIPPFLNYAALMQESSQLFPSVGALYDIGMGQKLYLGCNGSGLPTVILDAPTGMSSDVWTTIFHDLAKLTRVCVYDRAGLGFSERPFLNHSASDDASNKDSRNRWQIFTVERMVDDLHRLITFSSQQPRPLLLVGAEMGSLVSRFYAQMYEGDVTDVVLIDALTDDLFTQRNNIYSQFWTQHLIPSFQAMQLAAAVGLARLALLIGWLDQPMTRASVELPIDVVRRQKHLLCNPRHLSSVVDEHFFINESFSQMKTALMMKSFPSNVSVILINGNYHDDQLPAEINEAWASSQKNIVSKVHPGATHIVVNGADHHLLYRRPDAILEPIKRLVRKWRTRQNLA